MSVRILYVREEPSIWDKRWALIVTAPFRWVASLRCNCRTYHGMMIHIKKDRHILR